MHSQAQERNPRVFEPLKIGHVEVPNRIHMPPHVIGIETPVPGHEAYRAPAEDFAAYHGERAARTTCRGRCSTSSGTAR
jgi:2,4-dienoyl-CoA reductase-like NADH-dependent reductase (Old Yellow Enzyme family)